MGGGVYKKFEFSDPPPAEKEEEKKELEERKQSFGIIKVRIYDTIEVPARKKAKKEANYSTLEHLHSIE